MTRRELSVPGVFQEAAARLSADPRLAQLPEVMRDARGVPLLLYRGTQRPGLGGVRHALSFTDALPAAMIWSAVPPDVWSSARDRRTARLLDTSTVHAVYLVLDRPLVWDDNHRSLYDVLFDLWFGKVGGISSDEVVKTYNYLHNRLIGKAKGGEFQWKQLDDDGEEVEEEGGFSFSLRTPMLDERDLFVSHEDIETTRHVVADTFVFADAPAVLRAVASLCFDGLIHDDVFQGGKQAAKQLLSLPLEALAGIEMQRDLHGERVPTHRTWRPLSAAQVIPVGTALTRDLLTHLADET